MTDQPKLSALEREIDYETHVCYGHDDAGKPLYAVDKHARNCPGDREGCTCGLRWRIALSTEKTMHAAWRKRGEEAESELSNQRALTAQYREMAEERLAQVKRLEEAVGKVRETLKRAESISMDQLLKKAAETVRPVIMAETGKCPRCERPSDFCRCASVGPSDEAKAIREVIASVLSLLEAGKPEAAQGTCALCGQGHERDEVYGRPDLPVHMTDSGDVPCAAPTPEVLKCGECNGTKLKFIYEHITDKERSFRDLYPAFGLNAAKAIEMAKAALDSGAASAKPHEDTERLVRNLVNAWDAPGSIGFQSPRVMKAVIELIDAGRLASPQPGETDVPGEPINRSAL